MNEFFKTPKTKTLLWTLCAILALLVVFGLGIVVGYRRAIFASSFGENYYRNFYGDPLARPAMGMVNMGSITSHGVVGEVIDVGSGTIAVKSAMGDEASIVIASNTPIREMGSAVPIEEIVVGDNVAIIGEPNSNGQVDAKFIRIFESPSEP
jgi:hypothetical protein